MTNKFEVTLVGNDQIGSMLDGTTEKIRFLREQTDKFGTSFQGASGKEAQEGLSTVDKQFSSIAKSAKDNVQYIGDMVPPLKNFSGIAEKLSGTLGKGGFIGATVYGISTVVNSVGQMAQHAQDFRISAENIGLSSEKLSMITGAYKLSGVGESDAIQSISSIESAFNDVLYGRDNEMLGQLERLGFKREMIPTKLDSWGNLSVDVEKLLLALDKFLRGIENPRTRHKVSEIIGLDPAAEKLFNDNLSVQENYAQAYMNGLVTLEDTNKKLTELNVALTDTSASLSGWINKTKENLLVPLSGGGGLVNRVGEGLKNSEGLTLRDLTELPARLNPITSVALGVRDVTRFFSRDNGITGIPESKAAKSLLLTRNKEAQMVRAFGDVISKSEGTDHGGAGGYNVLYGSTARRPRLFDDYIQHPGIKTYFVDNNEKRDFTTAAGKYQIILPTWNRLREKLNLPDFSPESQDLAYAELLRERGVYGHVASGNWHSAIPRLGTEWASLPSSNYPQNKHSDADLGKMMQESLKTIHAEPIKLEVRFTNTDTGHSQTVRTQTGGTVTTAMGY